MESTLAAYTKGEITLSQTAWFIAIYVCLRLLEWGMKIAWESYQQFRKPNTHDVQVWEKIDSILSEQHIDYWRKHYVCDAFPAKLFSELDDFIQKFKHPSPQTIFLSNKLEKNKLALIEAADNFLKSICEAGTDEHGNHLKIDRHKDMPGRFEALSPILEDKADCMVRAYDNLKIIVIKALINKKI